MRKEEIHIRDPFVLLEGDTYYLYGTRGPTCWGAATGFDVYRSQNLENWSDPIVCFERPEHFWSDRNFWAPEVHRYQGAYYMFASFKADGVCRGTAILRATSPEGPFEPWSDGPVTPRDWECLDGTFYVDRQGQPYIVFCHEWVQVGDGEVLAMPLTQDLKAAAGEPYLMFKASEATWAKPVHHSSGVDGYVTDGPFPYRTEEGLLLCLWASFSEGGYTQGVACSESGEICAHFQQLRPLFEKDGGHGMLFRDKQGQLMLTLHSPNQKPLERPVFYPVEETTEGLRRMG